MMAPAESVCKIKIAIAIGFSLEKEVTVMTSKNGSAFMAYKEFSYWQKLLFYIQNKDIWGGNSPARLIIWRRLIFAVHGIFKYKFMTRLLDYFGVNPLIFSITLKHPCIIEQTTRQWLYHKSTMEERFKILKQHFSLLQFHLSEAALRNIYFGEGIVLWSQPYQEEVLFLKLHYDRIYRKEGLMAISFNLGEKRFYSVSFWIAPDRKDKPALWIGCIQGAQGEAQTIRGLTKAFFGYRPKNLMVFVIRVLARFLEIEQLYAASNYGAYVNHRFYADRRLKTSFDEFWGEVGGQISDDARFFELPCYEMRKSLQQVVTNKRNLYRKRFAVLDAIDMAITKELEQNAAKFKIH